MKRLTRIAIVCLSVFLVVNVVVTGYLFFSLSSVDDRVTELESERDLIKDYLLQEGERQYSNDTDVAMVERQTGHFLAYDSGDDAGVMFQYRYQPLPGDAVYVDASEVSVESTFQQSLRNAQEAVQGTQYEPRTYGMAISLDTPHEWRYIRGESAGLAVAAHIASTDPDYRLNDSVVLTGQVEPNGNVVSVEHIGAKGEAAGKEGKDLLIAPHSYAPVDAEGIRVVHVQTVSEALDYALVPVNESTSAS